MMTKEKYAVIRRAPEEGVALIFALAVLALLLVMLIGFLASSILEQRIAYNQSSQVASKLAARSALIRAESQLTAYADDLAWFRYRPDASHPKLLAPLVSFGTTAGVLADGDKSSTESDAFKALQPLMENYVNTENWFPGGLAVDYPQWVYLTANGRLTGRFAYAVIPNLGIDPTLLDASGSRVGQNYDELPLAGLKFLTNTKAGVPAGWLSLDLLTGRKGIYQSSDFDFTEVKKEFDSQTVDGKEVVNFYFTTDQPKVREKANGSAEQPQQGNDRLPLNSGVTLAQAQTLFNDLKPATVRDQVAANLVDYIDSDDTPTSNVDPASWASGGTPTYTGNEMTPYLNQIAAGIEAVVNYTVSTTDLGDGTTKIDQAVTIHFQADMLSELINIYDKTLGFGEVTYKDVNLGLEVRVTKDGSPLPGSPAMLHLTKGGAASPTVSTVTSNANASAVPARGYVTMTLPAGDFLTVTPPAYAATTTVPSGAVTYPEIEVVIVLKEFGFERAVLKWGLAAPTGNVDFVNGSGFTIPEQTMFSEKFSGSAENKTVTGYVDFEANDPRCNLDFSDWQRAFGTMPVAMSMVAVPNAGSKNSNADAKNTDPDASMDLESDSDPVKLSTAYIRNASMESIWELGLIHRGEPWKTINLKSTLDPHGTGYSSNAGSYKDDARLLDKVKIISDNEAHKFNINTPAQNASAFGVLTESLKYCPLEDNIWNASNVLDATLGTDLTAAAAAQLRSWIANKCYKVGSGGDPAASDAAVYQRYIHRGMLANVITDWALNGTQSPYQGKDPLDAHLEELTAKIVPLTRCGDTYEYFTVFAVGQAIKDVGSASGAKFVKYDADGTKREANCVFGGSFETDFDQITAESYLVARLRREIDHCEGTVNCQNGLHDEKCTFKMVEIESYTISEL